MIRRTKQPALRWCQLGHPHRDCPQEVALPSVASLKALRVFARKDEAKSPLIGFWGSVWPPARSSVAL